MQVSTLLSALTAASKVPPQIEQAQITQQSWFTQQITE
jgi:hypothetical protein